MKIDRVIFCLDNNPNYAGFWNINSKVWKNVYNVNPTLIYVGDEEDIDKNNISREFGEIIVLPASPIDLCNNFRRKWYITWALFYGPTLFPDEVCMTSGIDQIPLSWSFINKIENISREKYIVGFADAYSDPELYPSSHHVALGSHFKEKYDIDEDWLWEIRKVYQTRNQFNNLYDAGYWGLDESYSSKVISSKPDGIEFIKNFFHPLWAPRRIDRIWGLKYDVGKLSSGWYSEMHAPRPLRDYEQEVNKIISIAHGI